MNYTLGNLVGKGSDGEVYELIDKDNIKKKVVKFIQPNYNGIRNYLEPYILLNINHNNIIKADIIEIDDNGLVKIIQDKADNDLYKRMKDKKISNSKKLKYMRQLTEAVYFLQNHNIIHGDIKPQNILLFNDNIKLCDFSLSRIILKEPTICNQKPYTIAYRAPELKDNKIYLKSDIWALGCTLYEIFYNIRYFNVSKDYKLYHVSDHQKEDTFNNLIKKMLDYDIDKRLSIEQVIIFFNINKDVKKFYLKPKIKFEDNNITNKFLQKCYYDDKNNKMSKKYKDIEKKIAKDFLFDIYSKNFN